MAARNQTCSGSVGLPWCQPETCGWEVAGGSSKDTEQTGIGTQGSPRHMVAESSATVRPPAARRQRPLAERVGVLRNISGQKAESTS